MTEAGLAGTKGPTMTTLPDRFPAKGRRYRCFLPARILRLVQIASLMGGTGIGISTMSACDDPADEPGFEDGDSEDSGPAFPPGKQQEGGELAQGSFLYECISAADAWAPCTADKPFPDAVAIGAHFGLRFVPKFTVASAISLVSASEARIGRISEHVFAAHQPGFTSVMAFQSGALLDFLHIEVAPVGHLRVTRTGDSATIDRLSLRVGDSAILAVTPHELAGTPALAGVLEYAWTATVPGVIEAIVPEGALRAQIDALAPGETELEVSAAGVTRRIAVVVEADDTEDAGDVDDSGDTTGTEDSGDTSESGASGTMETTGEDDGMDETTGMMDATQTEESETSDTGSTEDETSESEEGRP